jgi:FkbM family methyltransferase
MARAARRAGDSLGAGRQSDPNALLCETPENMGWRRVIQMMQLYRNWPVALADRAGFLPSGRLVTFHIRTTQTDVQLTGETAVEDVRVLNEMWLEDPYLRGFEGLPPDTTCVVDIGANRGYFASRIACAYPNARVFSYEPEPRNAAILRLNVSRNHLDDRIQVMEVAVTPTEDRTAQLALAPLPLNHTMLAAERQLAGARLITVPAVGIVEALSAVLEEEPKIDLLKLDVEGLEPALLRAIPEDVFPFLNRIVAEIDDPSERDMSAELLAAREFSISVTDGYLYAWQPENVSSRSSVYS